MTACNCGCQVRKCACACHNEQVADVKELYVKTEFSMKPADHEPVSIYNPVETAIACDGCKLDHIDNLLIRAVWSDRYVPDPTAWSSKPKKDKDKDKS